jgi:subtilisin-like proprotein convertase family protein
MKQGNRRAWLLVGALVGVLMLAFAGIAGGVIRTKTFSSGTIAKNFGFSPTSTSQEITINKKRSKVKDVNAAVRITHTYDADVVLTLFAPNGSSVDLSSHNGGEENDYGSGSGSCAGTKTVFNDEAETSIEDGVAPFAAQFKPEEPRSELDGSKLKGTWRLGVSDGYALEDDGTLQCFELEIKYKKKKKHHHH